ncbi:MAG: OmpA family protein [Rhodobacteraceae bacterium]|jgi:OOP family OmpA-OmpF porin|nr:OmpA family protein [Paracoccaceae bacterium]
MRNRWITPLAGLLLTMPLALAAQTLPFPAPTVVTAETSSPAASLALATGPWQAGTGTALRLIEGALSQTAYRLDARLTTLEMLAPLRAQLLADGFQLIYSCEAPLCGGFDFRYDLDLLPEPAMHVDLADYRYLAAERSIPSGVEAVMIVISRSANAGFVQVSRISQSANPADAPVSGATTPAAPRPTGPITPGTPSLPPAIATATGPIALRLETGGALALDDLNFPSGAATLAPGTYASLAGIAAYLQANPDRRITLVGHTDASGGLDANIALSRRRAESVRRTLIDQYDLPPAQIDAQGVGFLSPRASNLSPEGRTSNRRVEVMLTNTQ